VTPGEKLYPSADLHGSLLLLLKNSPHDLLAVSAEQREIERESHKTGLLQTEGKAEMFHSLMARQTGLISTRSRPQ